MEATTPDWCEHSGFEGCVKFKVTHSSNVDITRIHIHRIHCSWPDRRLDTRKGIRYVVPVPMMPMVLQRVDAGQGARAHPSVAFNFQQQLRAHENRTSLDSGLPSVGA